MISAAFVGILIPLLFLSLILRHSRPLMLTFCWGIIAFQAAYLLTPVFQHYAGWEADIMRTAIFFSPVMEELLKSLPLYFFLIFAKKSYRPFLYIYGIAAGIGFAIEENLLYLLDSGFTGSAALFFMVIRSLSTCLMHGAATGLVAFSMTLAGRRLPRGVLLIVPGYGLAMAFHGAYNYFTFSPFQDFVIFLPLAVYILSTMFFRRASEDAPEIRHSVWKRKPGIRDTGKR